MINNKQKAILHIAKDQLGLSEEQYREILKGHGGAESSVQLDDFGFDKVLRFFVKMGFKKKTAGRRGGRPLQEFSSEGQRKVLHHLMEDLGWWPARLLGFVKKMTGKQQVEQLSGKEAQRVIEALKAMRNRGVKWN
jgi:phage gp16-like protein